MDENAYSGINEKLSDLKKELGNQSGELLEVRMLAGELRSEMGSLRLKLDAIKDLPFSFEGFTGLKSILDHYLDIIIRITDTDAGSILLLEEAEEKEKPDLVFYACAGPGSEKLRGWHFSGGSGIAGWVAGRGVPFFSEDVEADPRWDKEVSELVGYKTKDILCVPMKAAGRVLGVIEVLNKKEKPFGREDLDLLTFISGHASVMVENSRLLGSFEEKVRQLSTLMELSTLLNSTLRKEDVRRLAIEAATRLMGAEVGSLLLVDEKTSELYFEVALGDEAKSRKIKEIRLKIGEGIAGWVAKEAKSVIINDVQNDPRFFKGADKKTKFVTKNMVCVPVMTKGKVIGVLQAINKRDDGKFTDSDRESFESLANQVAIAIENSRLYDQLRQTFLDTAKAMAEAIEKRDPYTGGHTKRVYKYSNIIGRYLGLSPAELEKLEIAAVLHDVGKIGVSDLILGKQGPLDNEEFAKMKMHAPFGADIVNHVPALADIVPGIESHHERIDGKGYPAGLSGEAVPRMASIIAVADSFDAMTTSRPYRAGLSLEYAVSELKRCTGTQFEQKAVEAFLEAIEAGDVQIEQ